MRQIVLLTLLLTFSISSPTATNFPLTGERLSAFVEHPFDFALGSTRDDVLKSLGTPLKEERLTRQNPHDPTVTDVFRTFHYDGLEVQIGEFPGATPPASGLILVVLTGHKYKLKHQFEIGSSKKDVQRVLGWPETDFKMTTWAYPGDEAGYLWLKFTFHNEKVSRIEWSQDWD